MSVRPLIVQPLGNATQHTLLLRRVWTNNRTPMRWYYGMRNHLFVLRNYLFQQPQWALSTSYSLLLELVNMSLLEQDRMKKLRAAMLGVWDGLMGKDGILENSG